MILRVGIVRVRPVVIRPLLAPFPIDSRQIGARRCPDAGGFVELRQKVVVALGSIAADDAAQGRVGFKSRSVDADGLALHQAGRAQTLQNPGKDFAMGFDGNQSTRTRNRRVVGRRLFQPDAQKIAQRQRIRCAPRYATLRINTFKIADQQQPEIDPRWQTRPAHRLGVEAATLGFSEIVEPVLAQQLIEAPIKGVTGGRRQVRSRDPHRRLPLAFSFAHRHVTHCSTLRLTSGYPVDPLWMDSSAGRTVRVDRD